MRILSIFLLLLAVACGPETQLRKPAADPAYPKIVWPEGKTAALALTYDDSLASHLQVALPDLDRHGLKGTFYLTLEREVFYAHIDKWKAAASAGHELGNHTIHHPCRGWRAGRRGMPAEKNLDKYTVERMVSELSIVSGVLESIDGESERTFAYPCYESTAGGDSYIDAIRPLFLAARSAAASSAALNDRKIDLMSVTTYSPDGSSGADLIRYVDLVREVGGFGSVTFHGVGGEYISVTKEAHAELMEYLADQDDIWVDTMRNIARYVKDKQPGE